MEFFEVIESRRSVRAFLDRPVERALVGRVVAAGDIAAGTPTAGPRFFNVVADAALLRRISAAAKAAMAKSPVERARQVAANPAYDPVFGAPALVFVSAQEHDSAVMAANALQNAAASGENMLLAARALGLGACYVGAGGAITGYGGGIDNKIAFLRHERIKVVDKQGRKINRRCDPLYPLSDMWSIGHVIAGKTKNTP